MPLRSTRPMVGSGGISYNPLKDRVGQTVNEIKTIVTADVEHCAEYVLQPWPVLGHDSAAFRLQDDPSKRLGCVVGT